MDLRRPNIQLLFLATLSACTSLDGTVGGGDDWKSDTGYVGDRAAEVEASFTSKVKVMLPGKSLAELNSIAADLRANLSDDAHLDIKAQVTNQIKYSRNALKQQDFNLNLEGGSSVFTAVDVEDGALTISYMVKIESLVKFKDLEARGATPADLVGTVIEPTLPLVPEGLFERTGALCAEDGATPNSSNLFYYFDPARKECPLEATELVVGRYEVTSSLNAPTVYPEYDQLIQDGEISMVVIFGQIDHGTLWGSDLGFLAYYGMKGSFLAQDFVETETYPEERGHTLSRTYASGLKVTIKMFTPVGFADEVPAEESSERFRTAIRSNEIVYYNGHAFYGSLDILGERDTYPEGVYQIINMDACWSYAYYTKQVFQNRATDQDPTGFALVDVVNNTEPSVTDSGATAAILYTTLFDAADAVMAGRDATNYSWNRMISTMNAHAEERAKNRPDLPIPEIYGVSGVTTNKWHP